MAIGRFPNAVYNYPSNLEKQHICVLPIMKLLESLQITADTYLGTQIKSRMYGKGLRNSVHSSACKLKFL